MKYNTYWISIIRIINSDFISFRIWAISIIYQTWNNSFINGKFIVSLQYFTYNSFISILHFNSLVAKTNANDLFNIFLIIISSFN